MQCAVAIGRAGARGRARGRREGFRQKRRGASALGEVELRARCLLLLLLMMLRGAGVAYATGGMFDLQAVRLLGGRRTGRAKPLSLGAASGLAGDARSRGPAGTAALIGPRRHGRSHFHLSHRNENEFTSNELQQALERRTIHHQKTLTRAAACSPPTRAARARARAAPPRPPRWRRRSPRPPARPRRPTPRRPCPRAPLPPTP